MGRSRITVIDSPVNWGVYVWLLPDGEVLGNEDGDPLVIESRRGSKAHMKALADAAKGYGYGEGQPMFLPGRRKVTDEELLEQKEYIKEKGIWLGDAPDG